MADARIPDPGVAVGVGVAWLASDANVAVGALAGGMVALVLGKGDWRERGVMFVAGFLTAMSLTQAALDMLGQWFVVSPAGHRAMGFLLSLTGVSIANAALAFVERVRRRAADVADRMIDRGGPQP